MVQHFCLAWWGPYGAEPAHWYAILTYNNIFFVMVPTELLFFDSVRLLDRSGVLEQIYCVT